MKKLLPLALALLLLLSSCGTAATEEGPLYKVKNGTFTCSAQELIDSVNNATKDSKDFPQLASLPDNSGSIETDHSDSTVTFEEYNKDTGIHEIDISESGFNMKLEEDNGKLCRVKITWIVRSSDSDICAKADILTSTLLTLLVPNPESVQETISQIKSFEFGNGGSRTGDVDVWYYKSDETGENWLEITVHNERGELPQ